MYVVPACEKCTNSGDEILRYFPFWSVSLPTKRNNNANRLWVSLSQALARWSSRTSLSAAYHHTHTSSGSIIFRRWTRARAHTHTAMAWHLMTIQTRCAFVTIFLSAINWKCRWPTFPALPLTVSVRCLCQCLEKRTFSLFTGRIIITGGECSFNIMWEDDISSHPEPRNLFRFYLLLHRLFTTFTTFTTLR